MKPESFELIETVDRDALARHPVWKTYRASDRPWILAWGVDPSRLDAQLERLAYCGPAPLFPVLEYAPLAEKCDDLVVAAELRLAAGSLLPGYLLEPLAFGVFADHEYTFNRSLPDHARQMAERLASELGIAREQVFPMTYRSAVHGPGGGPLTGEILAPW